MTARPAAAIAPAQVRPRVVPPPVERVRPVASPAYRRPRHWGLLFAFGLLVLLPVFGAAWYLGTRAADQYASTLGFTVRSEDQVSGGDLLAGLSGGFGGIMGGGAGTDGDILYSYLKSQELVALIDAELDLRALYSGPFEQDPVLAYDPAGTIEDLTAFWARMVRISHDAATGLMELRVLAFSPEEATAIAQAIHRHAGLRVNALSETARADAMRYAQEDLEHAQTRLQTAREGVTRFRLEHALIDPNADIQTQMGLLGRLQSQLAEALVTHDLLRATTSDTDPRVVQSQRRIDVIEARIASERAGFGQSARGGGTDAASPAGIIAEFERLMLEREFAERAYAAALSAVDAARAQANRQTRYLATYIHPTRAEKSEYPQHGLIVALTGFFCLLLWSILSLIHYAIRDRR